VTWEQAAGYGTWVRYSHEPEDFGGAAIPSGIGGLTLTRCHCENRTRP